MVLHISTFHLEGGAGVAATRLNRALQSAGIESELLVHRSKTEEENVQPWAATPRQEKEAWAYFIGERLSYLPYEADSSVRFAFSPAQAGVDISEHPLVQRADIIHLHWINFGFLSFKSLKKLFALGKPVVWTLHDMWAFTGGCHYSRGCEKYLTQCQYCKYLSRPDEYDIAFQQFETKKSIYQDANLSLVSPSKWLNELVKNAVLTEKHRAITIPNCLDTEVFTPLHKIQVREQLNLPVDKKLILFAGANTQDVRKGFAYFQDAMNRSDQDYEVLVFGKANPASFANLKAKVHYLGTISNQEDMVKAYNAADVIAVPSLEDNLPNTIMEAMACGTPAVGFNTGGIGDMIDHKQNGYLADFKSAASLAEGIDWVIEHNQKGALSALARGKVLLNYTEEVVARKYNELYEKLLTKS